MPDRQNFDFAKLKEIIKSISLKLPQEKDYSEELFTMSLGLCAAVKKTFYEKSEYKFEQEPVIVKKPIIAFNKRMRVDALEKFNQTTLFATVHFYKNVTALDKNDPIGVIIVYVARKSVPEILRLLQYPYIAYDDDEEVLDGVGALANILAGQFKKEMMQLGYIDIEMSHFKSYINSVIDGINYPASARNRYEISFDVDGNKQLVVEMVMAPLPKLLRSAKRI